MNEKIKPFIPTDQERKLVGTLAAMGIPQKEICKVITRRDKPICEDTLAKHFRNELDTALLQANAKVAQSLFKKATDDAGGSASVTAAIFWLKTRAGWKETAVLEHTGNNGGPITEIRRVIIDPQHPDAEDILAPAGTKEI